MRSTLIALAFPFYLGVLPAAMAQPPAYDVAQTEWISEIIAEIDTVQPGMTRLDLLKVFATEGGLSTRTQRQFVHKRSPYIKVDVTFRPVGSETETHGRDADVILRISKPYLEYSIYD